MKYLETLGITISDLHYQYIISGKAFTLLIDNDDYYFNNTKLLNNCLHFKHIVRDNNNNKKIVSFKNHYFKEFWYNGTIYKKDITPNPLFYVGLDSSNNIYIPPIFSSYVQPQIWSSIDQYNLKDGTCSPLAWRNSLSFTKNGTPKDFSSNNQYYDPKDDITHNGIYNAQRTTIANSWYIFKDYISPKFNPDISINKVLNSFSV
jgi:hypothetical protein